MANFAKGEDEISSNKDVTNLGNECKLIEQR